jgi:hypothetical protein
MVYLLDPSDFELGRDSCAAQVTTVRTAFLFIVVGLVSNLREVCLAASLLQGWKWSGNGLETRSAERQVDGCRAV